MVSRVRNSLVFGINKILENCKQTAEIRKIYLPDPPLIETVTTTIATTTIENPTKIVDNEVGPWLEFGDSQHTLIIIILIFNFGINMALLTYHFVKTQKIVKNDTKVVRHWIKMSFNLGTVSQI